MAGPAPVVAQAPDFSKGFEMMVGLGLPDTKDWLYVRTDDPGYRFDRLSQTLKEWKPTGNAWIEPEADAAGIRRSTADGISLHAAIDAESQEEHFAKLRELALAGVQTSYGGMGRAKEADEAADAASLVAAVRASLEGGDPRGRILRDAELVAELFYRAAHWHRRGLEKPAAELVGLLFEHLPRKSALLEVSLRRLANHRQGVALGRFGATADWSRLQGDLDSILADFPRMWPERPLAERLRGLVAERAAGKAAPMVADGPFSLTPEQAAWWGKFTEEAGEPMRRGAYDARNAGGIWSWSRLDWPDEEAGNESGYYAAAEGGPFDFKNGWDWTAVMAAALGDETLTVHGVEPERHFGGRLYVDLAAEPEELSDEDLEEQWREMGRPKTRDELAREFLGQAVPPGDPEEYDWWETAEVEEARARVAEWISAVSGKGGAELTRIYFEQGSEEQKTFAATLMARTGTEEQLAELEALVLGAPQQGHTIAMEILRRRGKEGAPFLESFRKRLREEWKENMGARPDRSEEDLEKEFQNYFGDQLKSMETVVAGLGFAELLASFVADETDAEEFGQAIQALGRQKWTEEEARTALDAVTKLENPTPERRGFAFNIAWHVVGTALGEASDEGGEPAAGGDAPPDRELPDWVLEGARGLLGEVGEETVEGFRGQGTTLARLTLYQIDALANPAASQAAATALQGVSEEEVWEHFEARGRARLAGEAPPSLPDPDSVPEARRAELRAALAAISGSGWFDFLAGLSAAEKIVLRGMIAEAEPSPEWRKVAVRIAEVRLPEAAGDLAEKWQALVGSDLGADSMLRLLELCQGETGGRDVYGYAAFQPLLGGVRIEAIGFGPKSLAPQIGFFDSGREEDAAKVAAVAFAGFAGGGGASSLSHLLGEDGKWTLHQGDEPPRGLYILGEGLDEEGFREAFETYLADFEPGSAGRPSQGFVHFGRIDLPPSEKDAEE